MRLDHRGGRPWVGPAGQKMREELRELLRERGERGLPEGPSGGADARRPGGQQPVGSGGGSRRQRERKAGQVVSLRAQRTAGGEGQGLEPPAFRTGLGGGATARRSPSFPAHGGLVSDGGQRGGGLFVGRPQVGADGPEGPRPMGRAGEELWSG